MIWVWVCLILTGAAVIFVGISAVNKFTELENKISIHQFDIARIRKDVSVIRDSIMEDYILVSADDYSAPYAMEDTNVKRKKV